MEMKDIIEKYGIKMESVLVKDNGWRDQSEWNCTIELKGKATFKFHNAIASRKWLSKGYLFMSSNPDFPFWLMPDTRKSPVTLRGKDFVFPQKYYGKKITEESLEQIAKYTEAKSPDIEDVIHCLCSDSAEIIDGYSFEEWADYFDYNSDSISHKKIYDAIIEEYLKLKSIGFTDDIILEINDIDY